MFYDEIIPLDKGKIRFEYGPVSMVLCAWENGEPLNGLLRETCAYISGLLGELGEQLPELKKPWPETNSADFSGISRVMREAAEKTGDSGFTPMAAVAGTISRFSADFLEKGGATKVIINNGGDIALKLQEDDMIRVGIASSLENNRIARVLEIQGSDGIMGICTSGLGGRSFTLGVADAVTVLAGDCSTADCFATYLANKTYVASSNVKRVKAGLIDPSSDIWNLDVTTQVGKLTYLEIERASGQFKEEASRAIAAGHIKAAFCYIRGIESVCGWEGAYGD